jgi:peptide/nickel transport system permease protein
MGRFLAYRILNLIPVLLVVTLVVFTVTSLIPGDPARMLLGPEAPERSVQALRDQMGLNRPFHERYLLWLGQVACGDLGQSYLSKRPVAEYITRSFLVTLELSLGAMLVALAIAIPTAIVSAVKKGSAFDLVATVLAFGGISMPTFWLGILLMLLFAVRLQVLPAVGYVNPTESLMGNLRAMVLPSLALGIPISTQLMRYLRAGLLRVLDEDHVLTARMKGLRERRVLVAHVLKNALIPFVTIVGIQVGYLLAGAVVIEEVFALPGMGRLALASVFDRDYQIIQGVVLVAACLFVFINFIVDILYAVLDPRIRLGGGAREG